MQLVQSTFPHLATRDERGNPEQQDANECWVELVQKLSMSNIKPGDISGGASSSGNLIEQYFRAFILFRLLFTMSTLSHTGGEMETVLRCKESDDETAQRGREEFYTFSCFVSQVCSLAYFRLNDLCRTSNISTLA